MKTLLKRISTTKKKIVDPLHETFIFSSDEKELFHETSDNDLLEYNKNQKKKMFLSKQRQILIDSFYDEPKNQKMEIFLATLQNIKKHTNRVKQINSEKQEVKVTDKRQSVDTSYQVKEKSHTEVYNEPKHLKNNKFTVDNDNTQNYFSNRKINTPRNFDSQPPEKKNLIINNYLNKSNTNKKSLVKQNHNMHFQKILRIRENIRLKNLSLKLDDIMNNNKMTNSQNQIKFSTKQTRSTMKQYPYVESLDGKINTENNEYQHHTLSYNRQNRKKSSENNFKSITLQHSKQIQRKKFKRIDNLKKNKFYSRTPQLLHQNIL